VIGHTPTRAAQGRQAEPGVGPGGGRRTRAQVRRQVRQADEDVCGVWWDKTPPGGTASQRGGRGFGTGPSGSAGWPRPRWTMTGWTSRVAGRRDSHRVGADGRHNSAGDRGGQPGRAGPDDLGQPGSARVPQGGQGRAAGQQVPYPGPGVRRLPSAWVPGRRDAGQSITEPVRQASLIGGEIDVGPVEDAAGQQLPRLRCPV
jgi:hypothetical protein